MLDVIYSGRGIPPHSNNYISLVDYIKILQVIYDRIIWETNCLSLCILALITANHQFTSSINIIHLYSHRFLIYIKESCLSFEVFHQLCS